MSMKYFKSTQKKAEGSSEREKQSNFGNILLN